ncbi:potassium transporter-domain-containing protein [Catenaria anguillulae PL171]|uniref:Potassium transporter-domain-containing protein n=1 Tax=Catenaria anguillulae PL171 TaxID=765915 RepID=A0A1Y2HKB8_9FUNG|nr:potassium transporter-domain-containing protein [Catenaria anguillulae PL171]
MASKGIFSETATPADSQAALASNDVPQSSTALGSGHPSGSGRTVQPGSLSTASNASGASKPNIAPLLMMAKRQPAGLTRSTSNAQSVSPNETLLKTPASLADDTYNPFGEASSPSPLLQRTQTFRRIMSSASKSLRRHRTDTDASVANSTLDPDSPTGHQSYLAMAKKSEHDKDGEGKGAGKAPGGKARRMSLGAALMMPPPPRTANAMDLKTIIKFTISAVGILYGDVAAAPMFVFKSVFREGGGMLALLSLVPQPDDENCPPWLVKHYKKIFFLALTGCAFLLADGFVTPAISMLAALEAFHGFPVDSWRVWLAMSMMIPLFYVQRFGLGRITQLFPVILTIWFFAIAIIGAYNIYLVPDILNCLNPMWIVNVCILRGINGSLSLLSTVLLVVSGLEFLYADLGAFTRKPIMLSFCIVCAPFTMLSYIGQGAYLLHAYRSNRYTDAQLFKLINNLFFEAAPTWLLWPFVILGTLVSIAGSQSVISGCFAMLDQAISIRVIPPVESIHIVGAGGHGTYYTPSFCFVLFVGGIVLCGSYRSSDGLSEIIGFCVAGAMFITSVMIMTVMKTKWHWPNWKVAIYVLCVFSLDIVYVVAAFTKVFQNAWVTVLYSALFFGIMYVYVGTQEDMNLALEDKCWTMQQVRQHVRQNPRTKGCGVFIANHDEEVPLVLTMVASKLPALPEDLILLTVQCLKSQPFVSEDDRVTVRVVDPTHGVYRVLILFGFAERSADIMQSLAKAKKRGLRMKHEQGMTFYISKHSVQAMAERPFYRRWKHKMFEVLARNTNTQLKTLGLPPDKVMEVSNVLLL